LEAKKGAILLLKKISLRFIRSGVAKDLGRSGDGLGKEITKEGPDLIKI